MASGAEARAEFGGGGEGGEIWVGSTPTGICMGTAADGGGGAGCGCGDSLAIVGASPVAACCCVVSPLETVTTIDS